MTDLQNKCPFVLHDCFVDIVEQSLRGNKQFKSELDRHKSFLIQLRMLLTIGKNGYKNPKASDVFDLLDQEIVDLLGYLNHETIKVNMSLFGTGDEEESKTEESKTEESKTESKTSVKNNVQKEEAISKMGGVIADFVFPGDQKKKDEYLKFVQSLSSISTQFNKDIDDISSDGFHKIPKDA